MVQEKNEKFNSSMIKRKNILKRRRETFVTLKQLNEALIGR